MKALIATLLAICLGACAQTATKSNSEAVKEMADKAVTACGQGNVASVTTTDFKCKK